MVILDVVLLAGFVTCFIFNAGILDYPASWQITAFSYKRDRECQTVRLRHENQTQSPCFIGQITVQVHFACLY